MGADVELITAPDTSEDIKKKLIGDAIKINTIEDFDYPNTCRRCSQRCF